MDVDNLNNNNSHMVDLRQKLALLKISLNQTSSAGADESSSSSSSSDTASSSKKEINWPILFFDSYEEYCQYYCSARNDDDSTSSSSEAVSGGGSIATTDEKFHLMSNLMDTIAGQLEDNSSTATTTTSANPNGQGNNVKIAKLLGRGVMEYLEIQPTDVKSCVVDFASYSLQTIAAQKDPAFFYDNATAAVEDDDSAVYLDFMKALDEARYIMSTNRHPTRSYAIESGKFYHYGKKQLTNFTKDSGKRQKVGTATGVTGATGATQTNSLDQQSDRIINNTSNVNDTGDDMSDRTANMDMDTDMDDSNHTDDDPSTEEQAVNPGIEPSDSFQEAVRKLELMGWDEYLDESSPSNERMYSTTVNGQTKKFTSKELEEYLKKTYGWSGSSAVEQENDESMEDDGDDDEEKISSPPTRQTRASSALQQQQQQEEETVETPIRQTRLSCDTPPSSKRVTRPRSAKKTTSAKRTRNKGSKATPLLAAVAVTNEKKKRKDAKKRLKKSSPRRMFSTAPPKDGTAARRSRRSKTPTGKAVMSSGGSLPDLSAYVRESFNERQKAKERFNSDEEADFYKFKNLMRLLTKRMGWKYDTSNRLMDHTYVKSGGKTYREGGKHGKDFFHEEKEVIDYCMAEKYYEKRYELGLVDRPESKKPTSPVTKPKSNNNGRRTLSPRACTP